MIAKQAFLLTTLPLLVAYPSEQQLDGGPVLDSAAGDTSGLLVSYEKDIARFNTHLCLYRSVRACKPSGRAKSDGAHLAALNAHTRRELLKKADALYSLAVPLRAAIACLYTWLANLRCLARIHGCLARTTLAAVCNMNSWRLLHCCGLLQASAYVCIHACVQGAD